MNAMNILITLCGRGGSKGIPGKNIRPLNGLPLIGYSINAAKKFSAVFPADIALSTDSEEIKTAARSFGVVTEYTRPTALATDGAGKVETIADLLMFEERHRAKKYDVVLDLDLSSPLRTQEDLLAAFDILRKDPKAVNLFSVNPANRNPYFNMVEKNAEGYYSLVKRGEFVTRQSAPPVYDLNASFYFYRREFFDRQVRSVFTERSLVYVMPHVCFDLDHALDFDIMEFLLANNKLGFSL